MVALSGPGWRLATALQLLVAETDDLFPDRSTASDGSIGDADHASRDSDHNPDDGWVDAVDLTDDDAHGCDVGVLAHHLVASRDERVSYLIHKGTIWRGYDKPGLPAFTPQPYAGLNAHKLHLHVSVADEHRNSTRPWWPQSQPTPKPPSLEDDDMLPIIIHAKQRPARLLSGGLFIALDNDSEENMSDLGCKTTGWTQTVYDAAVAQAEKR